MNARPGRGFAAARAIVVAAGVIDVPVQMRRIEPLRPQPVAHCQSVKRKQIAGAAGIFHGQGERWAAVVSALPKGGHQCIKTPILRPLGRCNADMRQQAVFPPAIAIQPLLRHGAQIALVIARPPCKRIACQHAQFGQQFAHGTGFGRRQGQIVRRQRVFAHRIATGARVAARLSLQFKQQKILAPRLCQLPSRREAADAATNDRYGDTQGFRRRRQFIRLAQRMPPICRSAGQPPRRQVLLRRARTACQRRKSGRRQRGQESPAIHSLTPRSVPRIGV